MEEIIVHYETDAGETGVIPVMLGGSYLSAEEFVQEFLADHVGYTIVKIGEAA